VNPTLAGNALGIGLGASDLSDPFSLFDLPRRFAIDRAALEQAYRRVQATVHPDRFATASERDRRVALQWATAANEAIRTLRDPVRRATLLCERQGHAVGAESNTSMPLAFLRQQMAWREALEEAESAADLSALDRLHQDLALARQQLQQRLEDAIDRDGDWPAAVEAVRELMCVDRFAVDVDSHEHTLG